MPGFSNIDPRRRALLGGAVAGLAASAAGLPGRAFAAASLPTLPTRQVKAGELEVGVHEAGPADGVPVLLLHGYPYDIHSYAEVAPLLAARGLRVIVPHLRGYGTTRFLDAAAPRTAEQSAVALDQIALLDALGIERAVVAGYDWGARTGCVMSALWPQRVRGLVSVNGYIVTNIAANQRPAPARIEHGWWYQYYFATERGRAGLNADRRGIARILWRENSPKWSFDDATFDRSAAAWDNPDHVDVVVHNYRWRLGLAAGQPRYDELERRLAAQPAITVPAITLDGRFDGIVPATDGSAQAAKFTGPRTHRVADAGHDVPREAPSAFADAVIALAGA